MRRGYQQGRTWKNIEISVATTSEWQEDQEVCSMDPRGSLQWEIVVYQKTQIYLQLR